MIKIRSIKSVIPSQPVIEGAGVHLKRAFGFGEAPNLDPFLLLDDFHSSEPAKYMKGFPWHPHRGIETITYILHGKVEHSDSMGNKGVIGSGDVQWMTAGSGIIHQEMPQVQANELLWGFQLWTNLPASHKMMKPRYRDITVDQIPEVTLPGGAIVKVICGEVNGTKGPAQDIITEPEYFDVLLPAHSEFKHETKPGYTVFAYVMRGYGWFDESKEEDIGKENLVIFEDGDEVKITTKEYPVRFLFLSGKPIGEPVAWRGPIVMNTQEELRIAFQEYNDGTFIKK
jgi:quercetin 2,3-dioxygenase